MTGVRPFICLKVDKNSGHLTIVKRRDQEIK